MITHTMFPDEMEFTHAGAMETTAVLGYEPSLVHLDKMIEASDRLSGESAHALFRSRDVYRSCVISTSLHRLAGTGVLSFRRQNGPR